MSKLKLNIQYFGSTNKTTHYNLSQYVASDKPTYLVDYNSDMLAIDTAIYNAMSKATLNESNIGTMTDLTTESKSSLVGAINEVNTQVASNTDNISTNTSNIGTLGDNQGNLANLTTTAKNNLVSAINEVNSESDANKSRIENFNLTHFESGLTIDQAVGSFNGYFTVASNEDGSLAKVYGGGYFDAVPNGNRSKCIIKGSRLRPTTDITIDFIGVAKNAGGAGIAKAYITIKTNGDIEVYGTTGDGGLQYFVIHPCLIFVKDFGDIPE